MFFFFSSRRRHTRCSRDWSSDVCSSDLSSLGQWASYTMSGGQADGAKIRLAIVGQERRGDSTLYWFEINGSGGPPGQGGIVQLLVPRVGGDAAAIPRVIVEPQSQPARKLPGQMVGLI